MTDTEFKEKTDQAANNSVCEWADTPHGYYKTGCDKENIWLPKGFNFCPFCGRKIQVREEEA